MQDMFVVACFHLWHSCVLVYGEWSVVAVLLKVHRFLVFLRKGAVCLWPLFAHILNGWIGGSAILNAASACWLVKVPS